MSDEKMSAEKKMAFMAQLSLLSVDFNFLETKDQMFFKIDGDFEIDVLLRFVSSQINSDEIYFITEIKGIIGTNIDDKIFINFMSSKNTEETSETNFGFQDTLKQNSSDFQDELDSNFIPFIEIINNDEDEDEFSNIRKLPTVDQILDKINELGIESLTDLDKKILKNYK